ncbi:laminin subunit alpha-1-like [Amphiura filiformis]|uniref:laminin subunit alpha-1-like n=1 Tax=Amphiura filiformis TaxID=82378 RepID=UPI003B21B554
MPASSVHRNRLPADIMRIIVRKVPGMLLLMLTLSEMGNSETTAVNVALNKPITAVLTCGTPSETFMEHRQINLPAEDRILSTCDANNDTLAHPADLMVDADVTSDVGNGYTYWQSASLNRIRNGNSPQLDVANGLDTIISIDLGDLHYVESVSIQMGDSVRPTQMGIQKSLDGQTFTNWAYKVTRIGKCQSDFNVRSSTAITDVNGILCTTYSRSQLPRFEVITFELIQAPELKQWQQTRYVRFQFFDMPQEFGLFANQFHHYTVRDIKVMARCQCNDHATDCILMASPPETKMMYQCVCGGNTQGMTCHECMPFFNQYPYEPGTNGYQCGECNCFNHSDECSYDINVGNLNKSINADGQLHGGGVCTGCQNNTAGINCNECKTFYYRPVDRQQEDEDACQPCDCHIPGTRENTNLEIVMKGECVANNDRMLPPGKVPGDCFCKPNVQGQKCDECKDGYYDLTDANPNGCLSCNCFTSGTINGSNTCNKTSNGQCPCKANIFDRRCDQCQDGFFGLSADNPDGCAACDCDVGGAVTPACNKIAGQCTCRPNIQGRSCSSVSEMAYYGTLHDISSEFEYVGHENFESDEQNLPNFRGDGYVTLSGSVSTDASFTVPTSQLSGIFQLVLRVANDGPTQVDVAISPVGNTEGTPQQGAAVLPLCSNWCSQAVTFGNSEDVTLGPGSWFVEATVNTQGGAKVYLDYAVAIPVEFSDPSGLLGAARATEFTTTCNVLTNDMKVNTTAEAICLPAVFSLTTYYFDGAKTCSCDLTGSYDNNCDLYTGQCNCKPGVGGRQCAQCLPQYYNFRSTGCTPCECFTSNKVCDRTTGQCVCPTLTAGRRCDRCVTFAWGLNGDDGCQRCDCDLQGSISQQCDLVSGECDCYPGVGTPTCSECEDGFKILTNSGCQPCGCSPDGSLGSVCNKTDGQCSCKENTGGLTCHDCAAGTFYNSATQIQGCLQCICMGITTDCTSSSDRSIEYAIPTNAGSTADWELYNGETPSNIVPTSSIINGVSFVTASVPVGQSLSWMVPQLSGNLLGVYGTTLTFSLFYELDVNAINPQELEIRVMMQGMGNRYVRILGANSDNTSTEFTISMIESEWRVDNAQFTAVSRGEFLQTLVAVDRVLIGAQMNSALHQSRVLIGAQMNNALHQSRYVTNSSCCRQGADRCSDEQCTTSVKTLVAVDRVLIGAQMNSALHQSSIGGVSYYMATSPSSPVYNPAASYAFTVENCNCGPGYNGLSCEECAIGYYRSNADNHPYFGTCIPCECNGHSPGCDQATGQCLECLHNTQGFNCDECAVGYYGNATAGTPSDCTRCPCSPPKTLSTSCALVDGAVTCECAPGHLDPLCNRCADFHFGQPELAQGFCTPCDCTGNSETCDPITGVCLNCRDGTTGDNCERCLNMTYGDASQQNCQPCNCDTTGAINNLCDHETGQCICKPGIGNRNCAACLANHYRFSTDGCTDCACNEFGSISMQCNAGGACLCLAGVTGIKCDQCEPLTYGLPLQACDNCACNAIGAVGGSVTVCHSLTGQCPCKSGVGGLRCDMCELGYVEFGLNGCTKCDKCVETLLNSTYNLEVIWAGLWADASLTGQLQERDVELVALEPEANQTIQELTATMNSYSDLRTEIQQINQQQYYTDVNNLFNRALRDILLLLHLWSTSDTPPDVPLMPTNCPLSENYYECIITQAGATLNRTLELLQDTETHIERITVLQIEAQGIYEGAIAANTTILQRIDVVQQWLNIARDLYASAEPRVEAILQLSFIDQQGVIQAELSRSQNVSSQAQALHDSIMEQALECNRLVGLVNNAETTLNDIEQQELDVKQGLSEIDACVEEIDVLLNDTRDLLSYSTTLVSEALDGLQTIGSILGMAQSDILDGNDAFEDAEIIRVGSQDGNPPPGLVPNPFGINGWVHGEATARNTISTIEANMATAAARVGEAESTATVLEGQAQQIETIFQGAQAEGQTAVQAIEMYQETLVVMSEATSTSQTATATLAATQTSLAQRPVETIQQEAAASRQSSIDLRTQVTSRSTNLGELDDALTTANQTLLQAETLWTGIAKERDALIMQGLELNQLATNPGIQPAINQGTADGNTAISLSGQIISGSNMLDTRIVANQQDIDLTKEIIVNASRLNAELPVTVTKTETDLNELDEEVTSLQTVQTETAQIRGNITSKMAILREKLRQAQERIANTKQPVRFTGQSSISVNHVGEDTSLFNELQLEFKADQRDGLLFFAENANTNAFISLEIVTSQLIFKFNVRADVVAIPSPIQVCCDGDWYRVLATRYEDEGQLTVVKLSTMGASVNHNSSVNTYDKYFTFAEGTTPLFVGGLPQSYRTTKALSTDFEGCIANVMFGNQEFDLWRPDSLEGSTSCCEGPSLPEEPQPDIIPGLGFAGFGYLQVNQDTFDVYNQAAVSFEFRTFLQDAVLFLVSRVDLISYIGVYVNEGKVVYQMTTSGNAKYTIASLGNYNDANWAKYTIASLGNYNDANWYKVYISFNESQHNMDIYNVSDGDSLLESFSQRTLAPLRFSNLQYSPKILLGAHISALPLLPGTSPTQFTHGPNGLPFAGAINNLMMSNGSSWDLEYRVLTNDTVQQYLGVSFTGVIAQVAPGIAFKGAYAYAKLKVPDLLKLTQTITFSFKTFDPHGILAYSYDGQSFNKIFYVVLYHGNLFLQYNIGNGQSQPLQTRGLRLNTGQWQTVSIDFSGISASLTVNDLPTIYGNRQIVPRGIPITATNSYLYVGGVPETTPVLPGGQYPVRNSINSGIKDFAINGVLINFNDPEVVVAQLGMDLSGITPEVVTLPPLPYPTQPPPDDETPPAMSCAAPFPVSTSQDVRLGRVPRGYLAYDLTAAERANFQNSFIITMAFRTVSSNGVLLYVVDSATSVGQFMALAMLEGKLQFSIRTSTQQIYNITTTDRYDDGYWHEVVVLRINDFVAILVQLNRDYANNAISSNTPSTLTLGSSFYVGGIANGVDTTDLPVSDTFDGCIRKLEISFTDTSQSLDLNLGHPTASRGVQSCIQNDIEPGASFSGVGSWIQLENDFEVSVNLEITIMLRTRERGSALLLAVSASARNFFAIDIFDGSVRVAVGHQTEPAYFVRSSQMSSLYDICNGRSHEITVKYTSSQLQLTVDGKMDTTTLADTPVITSNPLFIGGVPDPTSISIGGMSTNPFLGCIQALIINGVSRDLGRNVNKAGISTGCPLPHI